MLMQENLDNKWVCPSDRHLSLRAKLDCGWSVRASSNTRPSFLSNDELRHIKHVISKAKAIECNEQSRVGEMICRLELMRGRSCGDGQTNCILCAERFGKFMGESPVKCVDCKNKVCSKCCVDMRPASKRASQSDRSASQWLCKICSESREVWKRSGAWFFRSLPNYVLPKSIEPSGRYTHRRSTLLTPAASRTANDGAMFHDRESISVGRRRSTSSESSDDNITVASRRSRVSVDASLGTRKSIDMISNYSGPLSVQSVSEANQPAFSEDDSPPSNTLPPADDGMASLHGNGAASMTNSTKVVPDFFGSLEFSLTYHAARRTLEINVIRAKNLKASDSGGYLDAYVKTQLISDSKKKQSVKLRTKTKRKSLNPFFNETLSYSDVRESDLERKRLQLRIYDEERIGSEFLGEITVDLRHLVSSQLKSYNVNLERPSVVGQRYSSGDRGKLLLGLRFDKSSSHLQVSVLRCSSLPLHIKATEYQVKLNLRGGGCDAVQRTSWRKHNSNPTFDELLTFPVPRTDFPRCSVDASVWERGKANKEQLIESSGSELRHWLECSDAPGALVEKWHALKYPTSSFPLPIKRPRTPMFRKKVT